MNKTIIGVTFDVTKRLNRSFVSSRHRENVLKMREKIYHFNTVMKHKIGDTVIVNCKNGLNLAHVADIDITKSHLDVRAWVVQKVTLKTHNTRMKKIERAEELKARLDEKLKEWTSGEAYRVMASNDAEAKRLYEELKKLSV